MNKFSQPLICLFFALCLISCKKDKEKAGRDETPAWFLFSKQMVFSGKVADSTVLWKYGIFEFQSGSGISISGNNPQHKYLSFWLTSNADLTTRFEIATTDYDSNSDALFSDVLSTGFKELGQEPEMFGMSLTLNGQKYTTKGDQTNSLLEVLKVEKAKDEFNRDMALVWFKTNCKFYHANNNTFAFNLEKGYILAGFIYNL